MCLMAGMELPVRAIREQIASAVDLIIHQDRFRDGTRKVVQITEVQGMEAGRVIGRLKPTGLRPKFIERIEAANIHLPAGIFGVSPRGF